MRAAAEQFEALFLQQMMAQARKSSLSEDILSNKGTETYNNLLDQERATELAKTLDLGIAEALMRQFGVAEKE
jgi:flagellar protein FlgJ